MFYQIRFFKLKINIESMRAPLQIQPVSLTKNFYLQKFKAQVMWFLIYSVYLLAKKLSSY